MKSRFEACEVVITAPETEWLELFCQHLLADRLCAAVHIFSPIKSTYWWKGEMCHASEVRASLHTRVSLVSRIIERTEREHPYEVPCVAVLPIVDGNPAYLEWVAGETVPE